MERAAARCQPVCRSNGRLDSSSEPSLGRAGGGVHLVAVRASEHEKVDVPDGSIALLAGEPCRPGAVDVRRVDPTKTGERLAEHPRNAECLDEHVRQPAEVRARRVGADEPCPSDEPTRHQTGCLGAFNLAMNGRIRDSGSLSEFGQALFGRRVAEDKRQQLGLLLGSEDRQE